MNSKRPSLIANQDLSQAGLIMVLDVDTGKPVFPPIKTNTNVIAVDISPDGKRIVALCHGGELLLISSDNGTLMNQHQSLSGHNMFYGFVIFRRLAFSPAGDRFAVWGSYSRIVEIRSAADGSLLFSVQHENESNLNWIHHVAWSADGKTMATCSADQTARLWNAQTGESKLPVLHHTGWVFHAEFSKDSQRLLTSCQDRQARLWNIADADNPLLFATPTQSDEVYATCFLPDEKAFLIGLRNGEITAWDARRGKRISPATESPTKTSIYTLALSPDGSRIIVVGRDPNVRGFTLDRWQPPVDSAFSRDELRAFGEMTAGQEPHDGVLIGLPASEVVARWQRLFEHHSDHRLFRWSVPAEAPVIHPAR